MFLNKYTAERNWKKFKIIDRDRINKNDVEPFHDRELECP